MVTVEGAYENIRRFIRDVERSKQFVVINQVELQRAQQDNAPVSAEGVRRFWNSWIAGDAAIKYGDLLSA